MVVGSEASEVGRGWDTNLGHGTPPWKTRWQHQPSDLGDPRGGMAV